MRDGRVQDDGPRSIRHRGRTTARIRTSILPGNRGKSREQAEIGRHLMGLIYEDDEPHQGSLESLAPDLLSGWRGAGRDFTAMLRDAENRVAFHPETMFGTSSRLGDIRLHTQVRRTYADPNEKARIVRAAGGILDATYDDKTPEGSARSAEALAAMRLEDERVFVAAILGATRDLVYWNWRYGYTVKSYESRGTPERQRFNTDLTKRRLAAPELAQQRYGELVTHVSKHKPAVRCAPSAEATLTTGDRRQLRDRCSSGSWTAFPGMRTRSSAATCSSTRCSSTTADTTRRS